jgi:hypothetical protein
MMLLSYHVTAEDDEREFERRDWTAVQQRVDLLKDTFVKGTAGLRDRYQAGRLRQVAILPPDPELTINMTAGFAVFQTRDFSYTFLKGLIPIPLYGVDVYPVLVSEDRKTRDTLFFNAHGRCIGKLAPVIGYDPYAWLKEPGSDFFEVSRSADELAWALALNDPARVTCTFNLLPCSRIYDMAEALIEAEAKTRLPVSTLTRSVMMTVEPLTEIVIRSVSPSTNGMVLDIAWPDDFTNRLEVLTRSSPTETGWTPLTPVFDSAGMSSCLWTDRFSLASGGAAFLCRWKRGSGQRWRRALRRPRKARLWHGSGRDRYGRRRTYRRPGSAAGAKPSAPAGYGRRHHGRRRGSLRLGRLGCPPLFGVRLGRSGLECHLGDGLAAGAGFGGLCG